MNDDTNEFSYVTKRTTRPSLSTVFNISTLPQPPTHTHRSTMKLLRLALATATAFLAASTETSAESQGVFEIKLNSFKNEFQRDSHGRCCRGYRTKSGQCSEQCATRFRVCLTHYQSQIDYSLNRQCTFGEYSLSTLEHTVHIPLEIKWPVSD